jgi:hypothetical protein
MGFFLVLKAEMVRNWIIMRRYWFATVMGLVVGYGMLMLMIAGFMASPGQIAGFSGDTVIPKVVGLIVGMFAFGIVGLFSQGLQSMASAGQLEQMCMSPHGLITNFMARSLVSAVSSIFSCIVMLTLVSLSVKGTLHAAGWSDWGPLLILFGLTYLNLIGFGFMVGGLVLIFKQVGQIVTLVRLGMIFLAMPIDKKLFDSLGATLQFLIHLLPITDATISLKLVLIDGAGWSILGNSHFFFLLVSCLIWTFLGVFCFRYMENWSRDKGTLGAY